MDIIPHSAESDVRVLHSLFLYLYQKIQDDDHLSDGETIERMIELSSKPCLLLKLNFGKYKNCFIRDIKTQNPSYFRWLSTIANDPNLIFSIKYWNTH